MRDHAVEWTGTSVCDTKPYCPKHSHKLVCSAVCLFCHFFLKLSQWAVKLSQFIEWLQPDDLMSAHLPTGIKVPREWVVYLWSPMAEYSYEGQTLHLQEVTEFLHLLHHFSTRNWELSRHVNGNQEGQVHMGSWRLLWHKIPPCHVYYCMTAGTSEGQPIPKTKTILRK